MRPSQGPLWSEKTGQHTATVVLTNLLTQPCLLRGYPVLEVLDGRGAKLDFVYSHGGDQMITRQARATVRVRAGGSAYFAFNKYRCDLRTLATARTLRIALPGSAAARPLRLTRYPIIDYCGTGFFAVITVSPIERRRADVFLPQQ